MLVILTGKPGTGKTMDLTSIGYDYFKRDNPPFKVWFKEKILRKKHIYTLKVYSDYPIVFKRPKKNKTYLVYDDEHNVIEVPYICCLEGRIFDLTLDKKYQEGSVLLFDEIQAKYDSMEYKDFPDSIAHFCQAHRHFGLDIYISSQSQSRIIKRLLVLAEEYQDIQSIKKIFGFVILKIRKTWDMSASLEQGVYTDKIADVDYFRRIFRLKKIGNMYDSKYLRNLQKDSKNYKFKMYDSLQLSKEDLLNSFFPSEEEKKRLRNMRY